MKHRFARQLRRNQSYAEHVVWESLRNAQIGFKFRRQQPIGPFIADFVCFKLRLVIEVDGDFHADQQEYDTQRTEWLIERGYHVVRFSAREVAKHPEAVYEQVVKTCTRIAQNGNSFPLPNEGEG